MEETQPPHNPGNEKPHVNEEMKQFQQQLHHLRAQAEHARIKTLESIRTGILEAQKNGLHQTLFPNNPLNITNMNPPDEQHQTHNEEQDENTQSSAPTSGNQAMAYTDDHVKDSLQQMSKQLGNAAAQHSAGPTDQPAADQVAAAAQQASEAAQKAMQASAEAAQKAIAASASQVNSEMEKAENAVKNAMAQGQGQQPASHQQPPGTNAESNQ